MDGMVFVRAALPSTHLLVRLRERIAGGSHGTHIVYTAVNLYEEERNSQVRGEQSHREILGTLTISSAIFPALLGARVHSGSNTSDNVPSNARLSTPKRLLSTGANISPGLALSNAFHFTIYDWEREEHISLTDVGARDHPLHSHPSYSTWCALARARPVCPACHRLRCSRNGPSGTLG